MLKELIAKHNKFIFICSDSFGVEYELQVDDVESIDDQLTIFFSEYREPTEDTEC